MSDVCIRLIKASSSLLRFHLGLKLLTPFRPLTAAALYNPHKAFLGLTFVSTRIGSTRDGIAANPSVTI